MAEDLLINCIRNMHLNIVLKLTTSGLMKRAVTISTVLPKVMQSRKYDIKFSKVKLLRWKVISGYICNGFFSQDEAYRGTLNPSSCCFNRWLCSWMESCERLAHALDMLSSCYSWRIWSQAFLGYNSFRCSDNIKRNCVWERERERDQTQNIMFI